MKSPRVHITYEIYSGVFEIVELPFIAGVLADLSGTPAEPLPCLGDRQFVSIDRNNFDRVLESACPRVDLRVPSILPEDQAGSELSVALTFRSLADFSPEAVALQIGPLSELVSIRDRLTALSASLTDRTEAALEEILVHPDVLAKVRGDLEAIEKSLSVRPPGAAAEALFDAAQVGRTVEARASAAAWLGDLLDETSRGDLDALRNKRQRNRMLPSHRVLLTPSLDNLLERSLRGDLDTGALAHTDYIESIFTARKAATDDAITRQLNAVMHHPDFQRLEATWRALRYFVEQTETAWAAMSSRRSSAGWLEIRVLNLSKSELSRDLEQAPKFDRSEIFKKVYEDVYAEFRTQPFAILIADYVFDRGPRDVPLLAEMARVAAEAHIVFLAGAGPQMLDLPSFQDLSEPRDLSKSFDTEASAAWNDFRHSEEARFVGLVLPGMLLRLPYGSSCVPVERFKTGGPASRPNPSSGSGRERPFGKATNT